MKLKLFFVFLFLISFKIFAQDQKWSVEVNYPISVGVDLSNDNPGIADLGVKYRFLDLNVVKIGVGLNVGAFHDRISSFDNPTGGIERVNFKETNWLFQPKVFAEFQIPGVSKLRPSMGLGYALVRSNFDGALLNENFSVRESDGGLNLNIGLSYDLTKNLFFQAQYDYVRYNIRNENISRNDNLGFLKLGIGFRF